MFHHMQIFFCFVFFWGQRKRFLLCCSIHYLLKQVEKSFWLCRDFKLHKSADFNRQFGSDNNLKHLTRLPPSSAVHMVRLAHIVLRSELMPSWAVGPALFDSSSGEGNCSAFRSREPMAELAEKQAEWWEGSSSWHKQILYKSSRD